MSTFVPTVIVIIIIVLFLILSSTTTKCCHCCHCHCNLLLDFTSSSIFALSLDGNRAFWHLFHHEWCQEQDKLSCKFYLEQQWILFPTTTMTIPKDPVLLLFPLALLLIHIVVCTFLHYIWQQTLQTMSTKNYYTPIHQSWLLSNSESPIHHSRTRPQ